MRGLSVGSLFLIAAVSWLSAGSVSAQDWPAAGREWAQTWGMHRIAVFQAASGDIQGAKKTLSQIDEDGPPAGGRVTAVWFADGRPIHFEWPNPGDETAPSDSPNQTAAAIAAGSPGWGKRDANGVLYFLAADRPANCVPATAPTGLPADYLAADPEHGAVVDFADERDSRGTRVTMRRYADGHAVIETPRGNP